MKALVAVLSVLVLLATPVAAQPSAVEPEPAPEREPEPETYTQEYGWKIALVDVASVALAVGGAFVFLVELDDTSDEDGPSEGTTGPMLWAVAGAAYLVGGPIIHSVHGNRKGAAKSFGLRAGLPLVGALTGSLVDEGGEVSVALAALGVVVAIVVDDATVAHREVRSGGVAPYAAPTAGGGVTLGVAGAF